MLELDGSEGGGQLVRTALTLSALTGTPFRMEGIRGGRPNPGLRPQHLAAVELLAGVGDADVTGATEGSETVSFEPDDVRPGDYEVDVGTAGSLPLVFDAALPLATAAGGRIAVHATGGTDVEWAPTMDYYRRVKLPLLRRFGLDAAVDLDRRGFYPAGGGEATLWLAPSALRPIDLDADGQTDGARVYSVASSDLDERDVAERQADAAVDGLAEAGIDARERTVQYADARSTGTAVLVRLDRGDGIAGFDRLGERGTPAEAVGQGAVDAARAFDGSVAAVDGHLADQLLVFLALVGGRVAVPAVTDHVETNVDVLEAFGYDVSVDRSGDAVTLVG